jgi:predicted acetyltransferase
MTFSDAPIDARSAELLAADGLRLALVDSPDVLTAWLRADSRGFHGAEPSALDLEEQLRETAYRRTTGAWDDSAADPATPVGTVTSWPTALTVPGDRSVEAWAIAGVTVAPTHRRRGIARALLEAELRTAAANGTPVAILTVSEATIYRRFGFAPAAFAADLSFDTNRVQWDGPTASGRVHFITPEQLRSEGRRIMEAARLATPGLIELDDYLWGRLVGVLGDDPDARKKLRAVRYDDASGTPQGFALYRVSGGEQDFTQHTVTVSHLLAVTDDAAAGLWRFLLELDLVSRVDAPLRAIDDPVLWQVSDVRGIRTTHLSDHLWVRILDVPAALEARGYAAPGSIALQVTDPLGFADGQVLITIDADGRAAVTRLDGEAPADAAALALSVNDLGSLYLGGVSAHTLERAGRVQSLRPGSLDVFDAAFRSTRAPWLSSWF